MINGIGEARLDVERAWAKLVDCQHSLAVFEALLLERGYQGLMRALEGDLDGPGDTWDRVRAVASTVQRAWYETIDGRPRDHLCWQLCPNYERIGCALVGSWRRVRPREDVTVELLACLKGGAQ